MTTLRFSLSKFSLLVLLAFLLTGLVGGAGAQTLLYDFNPDSISAGIGSSVASLPDSNSTGLVLTQATSANQPVLSNTAITGHQTLHSTGSMWMATGTFSALPTGSAIFEVVRYTQNASYQYPISFASGGTIGGLLGDNESFWGPSGSYPYGYRIVGGTQTVLLEMVQNGATSELRVNGTLAYTGSIAGLTAVTQLALFTDNPTTRNFGMPGDFARMQVYSAITNAQRAAIRASLASAYGVGLDTVTDVRFSTVTGTLLTSGAAYRIHVSANYSAGTPAVAGVICHGSGGTVTTMYHTLGYGSFEDAVTAQGGIVAGLSLSNTYTQAGLNSDIAAETELINYLNANYNVKAYVLAGESRGGVSSSIVLANNPTGKCKGWVGFYAAQDGAQWYSTSDATTNPLTRSPSDYAGKWMEWNASTGDGTVPKSLNSDAMYSRVAGIAAERTNVITVGNHGDVSNYGFLRFSAFVRRAAGLTPEYTVTGPVSGPLTSASQAFTVSLSPASVSDPGNASTPLINSSLTYDGTYTHTLTTSAATLTATAASGSVTGNGTGAVTATPALGATSFSFSVTPTGGGSKPIGLTNGQGWTNPASFSYLAQAIFHHFGIGLTRTHGRGIQ